jgi:hypothetical protein
MLFKPFWMPPGNHFDAHLNAFAAYKRLGACRYLQHFILAFPAERTRDFHVINVKVVDPKFKQGCNEVEYRSTPAAPWR